jgi:CRP-like cAMP-binding protein/CheY-like chemotaxis protein
MIKIIIIEDNEDIRENVVEILQLANYEVFEAKNGSIGLEIILANKIDLILCDIMMPQLDGYGVLNRLNKNPETANIPFVFLTAKDKRIELRKGMEMGADDYLTKPFNDRELLQAIESRLKKKELQYKFLGTSLDRLSSLISKNKGLVELKKIIEERKVRHFKQNQTIYYESDQAIGLYLVISGRVKTIKIAEDGRELITGMFITEQYLGAHAVLSKEVYSDTAIALEDTSMIQIPTDQLEPLLNVYPEVSRKFIKLLANDIREKEDQLLKLAYHSVRKRMSESLLRLYNLSTTKSESFKVTREDLAAMAGIATETVSRTLSDFKDEGLINKKGSTITILDSLRLARMKN